MTARSKLTLLILTPEGTIVQAEGLTAVNVPLADRGSIGIRPGHARLVAETVPGIVHYRTSEVRFQVDLLPGVLEVRDNLVKILTAGTRNGEPSQSPVAAAEKEYERLMQSLIDQLDTPSDGGAQ